MERKLLEEFLGRNTIQKEGGFLRRLILSQNEGCFRILHLTKKKKKRSSLTPGVRPPIPPQCELRTSADPIREMVALRSTRHVEHSGSVYFLTLETFCLNMEDFLGPPPLTQVINASWSPAVGSGPSLGPLLPSAGTVLSALPEFILKAKAF